jgi:hypothetical protein
MRRALCALTLTPLPIHSVLTVVRECALSASLTPAPVAGSGPAARQGGRGASYERRPSRLSASSAAPDSRPGADRAPAAAAGPAAVAGSGSGAAAAMRAAPPGDRWAQPAPAAAACARRGGDGHAADAAWTRASAPGAVEGAQQARGGASGAAGGPAAAPRWKPMQAALAGRERVSGAGARRACGLARVRVREGLAVRAGARHPARAQRAGRAAWPLWAPCSQPTEGAARPGRPACIARRRAC